MSVGPVQFNCTGKITEFRVTGFGSRTATATFTVTRKTGSPRDCYFKVSAESSPVREAVPAMINFLELVYASGQPLTIGYTQPTGKVRAATQLVIPPSTAVTQLAVGKPKSQKSATGTITGLTLTAAGERSCFMDVNLRPPIGTQPYYMVPPDHFVRHATILVGCYLMSKRVSLDYILNDNGSRRVIDVRVPIGR